MGEEGTKAALFKAVQSQDLPQVRAFVRAKADVSCMSPNGDSLLSIASAAPVCDAKTRLIQTLLFAGAPVDGGGAHNAKRPLANAMLVNDWQLAESLLARKADPSLKDNGETIVDVAFRVGAGVDLVKKLRRGARSAAATREWCTGAGELAALTVADAREHLDIHFRTRIDSLVALSETPEQLSSLVDEYLSREAELSPGGAFEHKKKLLRQGTSFGKVPLRPLACDADDSDSDSDHDDHDDDADKDGDESPSTCGSGPCATSLTIKVFDANQQTDASTDTDCDVDATDLLLGLVQGQWVSSLGARIQVDMGRVWVNGRQKERMTVSVSGSGAGACAALSWVGWSLVSAQPVGRRSSESEGPPPPVPLDTVASVRRAASTLRVDPMSTDKDKDNGGSLNLGILIQGVHTTPSLQPARAPYILMWRSKDLTISWKPTA